VRATAVNSRLDDWDRHWDDYTEAAAKNPAQAYRRRLILGRLAADGDPRRVLDIGSGTGDLAADIVRAFPKAEVLGLDVSEGAVDQASRKVPAARFVQRDLLRNEDADGLPRGWATHAVCSEVLEHVPEPARLLANARTYLAPGCRVIVTVPGGPMSAFDRHIGHRRHFTPEDVRTILDEAGLETLRADRAGFPFFNAYRLTVLLRGKRLVEDFAHGSGSPPARIVMKAFGALFRLNLPRSPWGWQIVATARFPGSTS
jgi:SAM-dependent methyltransferase